MSSDAGLWLTVWLSLNALVLLGALILSRYKRIQWERDYERKQRNWEARKVVTIQGPY